MQSAKVRYILNLKTKYKSGICWQRYGIVTVSYSNVKKNRVAYTLMYSVKDKLESIYIYITFCSVARYTMFKR